MIEFPILYEDEDVVVIDKPPGVTVNRAATVREATVQDWAEAQAWFSAEVPSDISPEDVQTFLSRSGLAHRLDRETSGVLLLAKHVRALPELLRQFRERETHKRYLGLVHGKLEPKEGVVKLPLGRSMGDIHRFSVDPEGKESETAYNTLQRYAGPPDGVTGREARAYQGFSLLELFPKTGRTHQLRVHLSHLHTPLVSDTKYAGRKRIRVDLTWCPRLFLHAAQLEFAHPHTKQKIVVQAALPNDLECVLKKLHKYD